MQVTCPQCNFSQAVADEKLPPLPARVTCPQCGGEFVLEQPAPVEPPPLYSEAATEAAATPLYCDPPPVTPPAPPSGAPSVPPPPPPQGGYAEVAPVAEPAGFWVRVVAAILDSILCNIVVFAMGFAVGVALGFTNNSVDPAMEMGMSLLGVVVSLFYYVFFTGYCGQTPGKMALRLKVVHNDGDGDIGYGTAFLREVFGKFLSGIILGIGYLMVAFRSDKRGLHDLIAGTRVIKL